LIGIASSKGGFPKSADLPGIEARRRHLDTVRVDGEIHQDRTARIAAVQADRHDLLGNTRGILLLDDENITLGIDARRQEALSVQAVESEDGVALRTDAVDLHLERRHHSLRFVLPQAGQAVELVHHVAGSRQLQAGDLGVFLGTDRGGAGGPGDGSVAVGDLNVECIGAGVDVGVRTQDVKATLAERLVESLWRQKNDAATVVDTIRADPVLSEPLRRAALRAVLWRATPAETAPGTAP
jgi:hypothetical protein